MQHCKREYCNAGTRQWSQRGIYIRKTSKVKNSEQIIIRSNDTRYRGYLPTELLIQAALFPLIPTRSVPRNTK